MIEDYLKHRDGKHFLILFDVQKKTVLVFPYNKNLTSSFHSKSLHPTLWKSLDRVIAYKIVLEHKPGRAKAVTVILWRTQFDPSESLELQLLD